MAAIPRLQILLPDPPPPQTPTPAPSHPSRSEPPGSAPAEDPGPAPLVGKVTETRASVSQPERETKFLVAELVPGPWRVLHDAVSPPPARAPTRPTAALGAPLLGHLLVPRPGESRQSHPCRSPSRPASAARRTPYPAKSSRDRRRRAAAPPCRPRSPLRPSRCARARGRCGWAGRTQQRPCQRPDRETRSPGGRARWASAREPIEAAGRGLWRGTALRDGRARASQVKQSTEGAALDAQTRTAGGRRLGRQPCRV